MKTFNIAGHLGSDLELRAKNELTWTRLSVACNGGKATDWFYVTVWGKLAQLCVDNLRQGDGVAVTGRLKTTNYKGEYRIELHAETVDFFKKARPDEVPI